MKGGIMVAGHLQVKKGYYYMVLSYSLPDGTPGTKWKATGLKVRGNKIKAQNMLLQYRMNFTIPGTESNINKQNIVLIENANNKLIPTMEEYTLAYMESVKKSIQGITWETRMKFAKHIIKGLGQHKVTDLTKHLVKGFINNFAATPYIKNKKGEKTHYSQDTINKVNDLLKNIVSDLQDEGYLEKEIMAKIKRPKSRKMVDVKNEALNKDQIVEVLNMVKDDLMLKVILHMLLLLGVRPGELYALKWSDIDMKEKTIYISKALSVDPVYDKTGKKVGQVPIIKRIKNDNGQDNFAIRTLKLTPIIEELLEKWHEYITNNLSLCKARKKNKTTEYLFCNMKNGELAEPQYYLRKYKYLLKKHGYQYRDFNFYRFRHTFATNALKQGLDLKSVQMLLGDNDPEMVLKIYTNMNKIEILQAHERFTEQFEEELLNATG